MKEPRIRIPQSIRAGEVFEVRTMLEHPMETGLRAENGQPVPRDMIHRLEVTLDGAPLLSASLRNGTAANPYHVFFVRLARSGDLVFTWTDEAGRTARASRRVTIG